MIDWELVAKIAGGGFGSTLIILVIVSIVIWLIGLVMRRKAHKVKDESE
jgi:hypothetical protein